MRPLNPINLIVFASITAIAADASITRSNAIDMPDLAVNVAGISASRFLRTGSSNEERAGLSVPAVEKLKTVFKSPNVSPDKLQRWLDKGKPADTVFTRLKLTKAGDSLFRDPKFKTWIQYVDELTAKTSQKGTSAILTLIKHYGDDKVYEMIEFAKYSPETKDLATRLRADLVEHWVATRKDPDEVFRVFKIDKAGTHELRSPEFIAWTKYVDELKVNNPATLMIPTLRKHYTEFGILSAITSAKSVEGTKGIAAKLEDELILLWLHSRKTPDDLRVDLDLRKWTSTFLENPVLLKYLNVYFSKYPDKKTAVFEKFTLELGDENVAKKLVRASSEDATKDIAKNLQSAQLEMWLNNGKSADDVFNSLKLHYTTSDFSHSPLGNTWVSYMNAIVKNDPSKTPTLFANLETRLSDRPLLQILQMVKTNSTMKDAAIKLETKTIHKIFTSGKPPKDTFELLGLDGVGDNILSSPLFQRWKNYVNDFNEKNPNHQESWFKPLRIAYGRFGVESVIDKGMQVSSTVGIAKQAERARLTEWLDMGKTPIVVFKYLHLNEAGEKTLASPKYKEWVEYLNDFNHRYPDLKTAVIDGIRANYYDINLLPILNAAKKDPSTEKLATQLQNALIDKWVAEKKEPAQLIRRFGYMKHADEMIQRYIKKLNEVP
ncbi:hypothetical protein F443_22784 [Phytophthora nicotianae P1569]|uniref:RxLR effector PexRD54 WY domain-containing protein n=1 Tax=Phytophthora nicotianae P1569 TaxID=1317065 RepID=V9DT71_PHYNI|nr:hypothetical protein F443_22784 [Phytophthora nicotianae P1569]